MQVFWQKIHSETWVMVAALSFASASAWAGSAGELKSLVPPEHMEQAKSFINPFTPTEEFIANGKRLYDGKGWCAFCHGWEEGGSPSVRRRNVPPGFKLPTNFQDAAWQAARSDGEIFWILIHGSHGTDMVPYMPMYITDKEAWQIIAYIRTLAGT